NIPATAVSSPPPGMVLIPAGPFTMGDTLDSLHQTVTVTLSAFYMDINVVTWSKWLSVYYWATNSGYRFFTNTSNGAYQASGVAVNHPVQMVNWYDCVKWCNARSQQVGRSPVYYTDASFTQEYTNGEINAIYANWAADGYRLPTEAEMEKAIRGGLN